MENEEIIEITRQTIWMMIKLGAPVLLAGLTIGIIIALFQALTQLQEMTLTFVPKILVVFTTLIFILPWISGQLIDFTEGLADIIINIG